MSIVQCNKTKTFRSKKYLDFIRSKPCLVCGKPGPSDPHHENLGFCGVGMKAPDTHTVPLCRECHQRRHITGVIDNMVFSVPHSIIGFLTEYLGKVQV